MPRLVRDRTTLLIYAQLAIWGYFLYGFGPVVPLLRDEQGVSAALAGLHGTGLALGIVFGGLLFTALTRRVGRGATIWIGMAGVVVVVAALWVARPLPLTVAAAVFASVFGSLIVNGVNAALSDHHGPAAPAAISEANAAAAFTGLIAPLVVGGAVALGLGWRPALTVEIALIGAVVLFAVAGRVYVPRGGGPGASASPGGLGASASTSGVAASVAGGEPAAAGDGRRVSAPPAGLGAAAAGDGFRALAPPGGLGAAAAGDGLRALAPPGGLGAAAAGDGLRALAPPGGLGAAAAGDGLGVSAPPGGLGAAAAGDGLGVSAPPGGLGDGRRVSAPPGGPVVGRLSVSAASSGGAATAPVVGNGLGAPAGAASPSGHDGRAGAAAGPPRTREPLPRPYWIAWTLMAATASIEVCLSLWAVDVLRTHAGLPSGAAAAAISGILVGMFVGRLVAGRLALRVPPVRLLLIAFAVSFVGFAIFWASTAGWLAVAGLVIAGLGNAVHYPLAISMALEAAPGQADRAAGFSSYSIAVGFGVAPFALGWLADQVGAHQAFLILPAFIAAGIVLTLWFGRATRAAVPVPVGADR